MTKDEIAKARKNTLEELQLVLAQVDKEEADDRVERAKRFNVIRNEARSAATAQIVGLLDAAMKLLDSPTEARPAPAPAAAKTAAPPPAPPPAAKTAAPRPGPQAAPKPAPVVEAPSNLPASEDVF